MNSIIPDTITRINKSLGQGYDMINKVVNTIVPFKQITKSKIVSALPTTTVAGTVTKVI